MTFSLRARQLAAAALAAAFPGTAAAEPCSIVDRGSPLDGVTTITVLEPPRPCLDEPFAGWRVMRLRSDANDNGVSYEIDVRWNRAGRPVRGSFTWLKGGPGTRSIRRATARGAAVQDELDAVDGVRSIELTFAGEGLEAAPRNGFVNLSAVLADVWEYLATAGIAQGALGHFGSSAGSLQGANAIAYHRLDEILDGVVFGGGPFWTDLRETCLDSSSPIFAGTRIRRPIDEWNWDGQEPCATFAGVPEPAYECRSLLGPGARTTYPRLVVAVIVGANDWFNPWIDAAAADYWRRIEARRKSLDRPVASHCVLSTEEGAAVVLRRVREIVDRRWSEPESPELGDRGARLVEIAPNPFPATTRFRVIVPGAGLASLTVHDVRGARVTTLLAGDLSPGAHEVTWDGTDGDGRPLPAGIYFARWKTPAGVTTDKLLLVR